MVNLPPYLITATDWRVALQFEWRKLGQTVFAFQIHSREAACSAEVFFASVSAWDAAKAVFDLRTLSFVNLAQQLFGIATPLQAVSERFSAVEPERPFSLSSLHDRPGTIKGISIGLGFGYLSYSVEATGLFRTSISGITASVAASVLSTTDGKWRVWRVRPGSQLPTGVSIPPAAFSRSIA
jgi:hypothetical protein